MTMKCVSRIALVFAFAAACALSTLEARAQGTVKMPLEKAEISGDMAKKAAVKEQLAADLAQDIVNECVRIAKGSPGGTLSVFVLAPDGEILAAHRMDGQNKINTVTGYKKAQTSLWLRIPTHQAVNQFGTLDSKITRLSLDMYLVAGGLPIMVDDVMIGSIGVGGSANIKGPDGMNMGDEAVAVAALTKVLGPQPPMAPNQPADPLGQNGRGGGGGAAAGAAGGGAAGAGGGGAAGGGRGGAGGGGRGGRGGAPAQ
jgi:uncharacterized protein GlcG (DUF336 family)